MTDTREAITLYVPKHLAAKWDGREVLEVGYQESDEDWDFYWLWLKKVDAEVNDD